MNAPSRTTSSRPSPDNITRRPGRREWLIQLGIILGMGAAAAVYISSPAFYVSEATLLVRYIVEPAIDPVGGEDQIMRPDSGGANILNTEVEILNSQYLAQALVKYYGVGAIFPVPEGEQQMSEKRAAVELLMVTSPRRPTSCGPIFVPPRRSCRI